MMMFTAEKMNFQGEAGYMLKQLRDGKEISSQFIAEKYFNDFCKEAGIAPDMIIFVGGTV